LPCHRCGLRPDERRPRRRRAMALSTEADGRWLNERPILTNTGSLHWARIGRAKERFWRDRSSKMYDLTVKCAGTMHCKARFVPNERLHGITGYTRSIIITR